MLMHKNKFYFIKKIRHTIYLITILCFIISPNVLSHTYSVPEKDKEAVWRIKNPDGKYGTGFVLSDSVAGFFLVTNKHVVKSKLTGEYFDSVQVFKNIITLNNKTKSTDSPMTLRLKYKDRVFFIEHAKEDVDLVFIQLGKLVRKDETVLNPNGDIRLVGWRTSMIADTRTLKINDGTTLQLIGYSLKLQQPTQYPISRYGKISAYTTENISLLIDEKKRTSEWIIVDASVRGGHSGGPAFCNINSSKKLVLIGFVQATSKDSELTFVIPSHYILELLNKVREMIK